MAPPSTRSVPHSPCAERGEEKLRSRRRVAVRVLTGSGAAEPRPPGIQVRFGPASVRLDLVGLGGGRLLDSSRDEMDHVVGCKFKFGQKIGSASFGELFLAVNVQTGEEVAVKLVVLNKMVLIQMEELLHGRSAGGPAGNGTAAVVDGGAVGYGGLPEVEHMQLLMEEVLKQRRPSQGWLL